MDWASIAATFATSGGLPGLIMFVVLVILFFWMRHLFKQNNENLKQTNLLAQQQNVQTKQIVDTFINQQTNILDFLKNHEAQDNNLQSAKIDKLCDKIDLLVSEMVKNTTQNVAKQTVLNDIHTRVIRIEERQKQCKHYSEIDDEEETPIKKRVGE